MLISLRRMTTKTKSILSRCGNGRTAFIPSSGVLISKSENSKICIILSQFAVIVLLILNNFRVPASKPRPILLVYFLTLSEIWHLVWIMQHALMLVVTFTNGAMDSSEQILWKIDVPDSPWEERYFFLVFTLRNRLFIGVDKNIISLASTPEKIFVLSDSGKVFVLPSSFRNQQSNSSAPNSWWSLFRPLESQPYFSELDTDVPLRPTER